jgi:hypothetical protein
MTLKVDTSTDDDKKFDTITNDDIA